MVEAGFDDGPQRLDDAAALVALRTEVEFAPDDCEAKSPFAGRRSCRFGYLLCASTKGQAKMADNLSRLFWLPTGAGSFLLKDSPGRRRHDWKLANVALSDYSRKTSSQARCQTRRTRRCDGSNERRDS